MPQDKKVWVLQKILLELNEKYGKFEEEELDIIDSFGVLATRRRTPNIMYRGEFRDMLEQRGLKVVRSRDYPVYTAQIDLKPFFGYDMAQGCGFNEAGFKRSLFSTQKDTEENELYIVKGVWVPGNYNLPYFLRARRLFHKISSKNGQEIPLEIFLQQIEENKEYNTEVEKKLRGCGLKLISGL